MNKSLTKMYPSTTKKKKHLTKKAFNISKNFNEYILKKNYA